MSGMTASIARSVTISVARCLPESCFYFRRKRQLHVSLQRFWSCGTHAPESLDSHACTHLAPPGPQMPARVTAPRPPQLHTGALDHHAPGLCASAANSLVGAPLHGCSRADEAHREAHGVRGRNIECKEIHSTLCTRLRSGCPTPRHPHRVA